MFELAAVTYGVLLSFVFSSLHHNMRVRQRTPAILTAMGYFLVGVTAAISMTLFGMALSTLLA